jgi:hypothetical protein
MLVCIDEFVNHFFKRLRSCIMLLNDRLMFVND